LIQNGRALKTYPPLWYRMGKHKKPILPFDLKPIKEDGTIIKYDYYLMFSGTYICRDSKLYLFY
jgi:hypothetical protein